jgi:hypothetical protein
MLAKKRITKPKTLAKQVVLLIEGAMSLVIHSR